MLWRSLARDRSGAAAAEMALVSPMLIILMFGSFELGNYFLDEHVVLKAVRDGARYAARQNFTTMPCSGTPTADAAIKNLVRYGNIEIGRASCRERVVSTCRSRWSPYH